MYPERHSKQVPFSGSWRAHVCRSARSLMSSSSARVRAVSQEGRGGRGQDGVHGLMWQSFTALELGPASREWRGCDARRYGSFHGRL